MLDYQMVKFGGEKGFKYPISCLSIHPFPVIRDCETYI
jgi:hypothetical protein